VKLEENLVWLHKELEGRPDQPSHSVCFVIKQPKFSENFAADFWDCVVHHVWVKALEGVWEPIFLHDSYAYRKGKGTHRAAMASEALKIMSDTFLRKRFEMWPPWAWMVNEGKQGKFTFEGRTGHLFPEEMA